MKDSSETMPQSSLRSANFILLVLGQGISLFGNTMLRFAMSMWVLDETASSTTFATVLAISVIPTILISPFGGVMADRVSKRAMMVALDIISGIVTLLATAFFALSGFNILAIAIMQVVLEYSMPWKLPSYNPHCHKSSEESPPLTFAEARPSSIKCSSSANYSRVS
ncbi:MAG: MFS transporter [Bifidobacterium catenulatum]